MAPAESSLAGPSRPSPMDKPAAKACTRCRSLKAKCIQAADSPEGLKCQRCLKAGPEAECIFLDHRRGRKVGFKTKKKLEEEAAERIAKGEDRDYNGNGNSNFHGHTRKSSHDRQAPQPSQVGHQYVQSPGEDPNSQHSYEYDRPDSPRSSVSRSVSRSVSPPFTPAPIEPQQHPFHAAATLPLSTELQQIPLPMPPSQQPLPQQPPELQNTGPSHQNLLHLSSNPTPTPGLDLGVLPRSRNSMSIKSLFNPPELKPDTADDLDNGSNGLELYRADPVKCGYISEAQAQMLITFFMSNMYNRVQMFDPEIHTHDYIRDTSPLLYCTMISIALKFSPNFPNRITTHTLVLGLAKDHILRILTDGSQSLETVQALLVGTEYKEANDENGYILLGLAIRIAMDIEINTYRPDLNERQNRNRLRTWFALHNADRRFSACSQTVKHTIMPEDSTISSCSTFHRSPLRTIYDTRFIAGVQFRRLMSKYMKEIHGEDSEETGLVQLRVNLREVVSRFESEVSVWVDTWSMEEMQWGVGECTTFSVLRQNGRLILGHHWLHQAFLHAPKLPWLKTPESWALERMTSLAVCLDSAQRLLEYQLKIPNHLLASAADSTHLNSAYATFFFMKIFKARVNELSLVDNASMQRIYDVIRTSAEKLQACALNATHTVAHHGRLLAGILDLVPVQHDKRSQHPALSAPATYAPPASSMHQQVNPLLSQHTMTAPTPELTLSTTVSTPLSYERGGVMSPPVDLPTVGSEGAGSTGSLDVYKDISTWDGLVLSNGNSTMEGTDLDWAQLAFDMGPDYTF